VTDEICLRQGFGEKFVQLDHSRTSNSLYLHEKWNKARVPASLFHPLTPSSS
jgi:hypothetical protein